MIYSIKLFNNIIVIRISDHTFNSKQNYRYLAHHKQFYYSWNKMNKLFDL